MVFGVIKVGDTSDVSAEIQPTKVLSSKFVHLQKLIVYIKKL